MKKKEKDFDHILRQMKAIVKMKKTIAVDALVKFELIESQSLGSNKQNTPIKFLN